jgi:hypothetical protein
MFDKLEVKWVGKGFDQVREDELQIINAQRAKRCQQPTDDLDSCAGIAISGGGIRSASFSLGVLQALEHLDLLRRFDYMSTVSGGGYIGSALTWFNRHPRKPAAMAPGAAAGTDQPHSSSGGGRHPAGSAESAQAAAAEPAEVAGTEADVGEEAGQGHAAARADCPSWRFPFCSDKRHDFAEKQVERDLQDHHKTLYTELDFIREHGNYLVPSKGLTTMALFGVLLRNSLTSAFVYLGLLVMLLWAVNWAIHPFDPVRFTWLLPPFDKLHINPVLWFSLAGMAVMVVLTVFIGISTRAGAATKNKGYARRNASQAILGWVLLISLVSGAVGTLPYVTKLAFDEFSLMTALGALPLVLGPAGAIYQFFWQKANAGVPTGMLAGLRIWITALLLIYGLLLLAFVAQKGLPTWQVGGWFIISVVLGFRINTNLFGIGRMYRDRLMETFLPDWEAVKKDRWQPAREADEAFLKGLCGKDHPGPYHLINCHVVLTDSDIARYRNRGGDNFVMSHKYCGGDAIGWFSTEEFEGGKMTLATAMSISGAAVNPRAGVGGHGVTRNRLVSFMLALFNIRLGFWADNPRVGGDPSESIGQPNFFRPGLFQGLFGHGMHRRAPYLELTDGGHFDNTGLYELIRRRLSLILLSQAGEDANFAIDDLANAIERARADFGVVIRFTDEETSLRNMVPGTAGEGGFGKRMELSEKGYAIAQIQYPPDSPGGRRHYGTLVILKTVLTENLPPEIYSYKATNSSFPHQSTADQFFGEEQLEAYRELGFKLCYNMLQDTSEVHQLLGK